MATMNGLSKRGAEAVAKDSPNKREQRRRRRGRRERRSGHLRVSTLMYAAQQGDVNVVRKIIGAECLSLFQRDRTGKTALHYTTNSGSRCAAQAADLMVMAAPDLLDGRDEDGFTPLHLAVIAGNMQLVTFLLANGADVNAVDNEKHTVVHWATVCGETAALRAVLVAGAKVSTPDVHGGYPLHYAAQMCGGDRDSNLGLQVLQTLLSHSNIDVTVTDVDKREPLLWAASAGSAKAVLALIRAGASVETSDKDGLTALHCAASRGHTDCMDTLLTLCGASVDIIDTNGCTALHYAVTLGHADATALLLAHGADPNRQDRKGRSPAHCGCAKGQFETVKLLGAHGANLWLRNARGDFPLHDAAASGRRELVVWLLEIRPSQVNARNNDGRTPLHNAAMNESTDMCKVSTFRKETKNKPNNGNIKDAMNYFEETIEDATELIMDRVGQNIVISSNILLDAGAHVNPILRTSKNVFMTPLDCALQKGCKSTAKYLQLNGGVPAARLSDPSHQQINSALNLQIREDVTLYGDTSSDNEEKPVASKIKKPLRKKASVTESQKLSKQKTVDKTKNDELKRTPSRIDLNNEIIINGKSPVNVTQSNEIRIEKESVQTQTSAKLNDKDRRPKSAKHRFRDKSAQSNIKQEMMISISSQASISKEDHSTSTSDEPIDKQKLEEVVEVSKDQISFTSEDIEEPKKDIVVEAAVHPQPKSQIDQKETENKEKESKGLEEMKEKINELHEAIINRVGAKTEDVNTEVIKAESDIKDVTNEDNIEVKEDHDNIVKETTAQDDNKDIQQTENNNNASDSNTTQLVKEEATETKVEIKEDENEKIIEVKDTSVNKEEQYKTNASNKDVNEENSETITKDDKPKKQPQPKIDETNNELIKTSEASSNNKLKKKPIEDNSDISSISEEVAILEKNHRSFRVLDDTQVSDSKTKKQKRTRDEENRSKSLENRNKSKSKQSKIPTPLYKNTLSKSERNLNQFYKETNLDVRIPSLPNIRSEEPIRCDSNMSAPLLTSMLSDKDRDSASDFDDNPRVKNKRFIKKRSKVRDSRSAGSDYESSNLIDSGFEPSPRSNRISKWRNVSDRGVNMTSVTQSIQTNIRRYHMERKIFQQLLELKRHQIRAGQHNEAILVKRAIDDYNKSCASTVGIGRYIADDFSFKSFEKFLYEALRKLQKNGADFIRGLPETPVNPMFCTKSTNRCMHATHAYTGVPCAAYLPKMDHHSIPKIGFNAVECKPGTGSFLPTICPKKAVTLELSHGNDKQIISLPTDKLDQNKRYYVTFTVKGYEGHSDIDGLNNDRNNNNDIPPHRHSKSD